MSKKDKGLKSGNSVKSGGWFSVKSVSESYIFATFLSKNGVKGSLKNSPRWATN